MSTVGLEFATPELEQALRPLCEQALQHFVFPDSSVLCYFDDRSPEVYSYPPPQGMGALYCGFFCSVTDPHPWLPDPVVRKLWDYDNSRWKYKNLVYLRDATCESVTGTVVTLSHELTHYAQMYTKGKVWWASTLLYRNLLAFDPSSTAQAWHIPHEHEAQLRSKRVSVAVLGAEAVNDHAQQKIAANHDPGKWTFFQSLSVDAPFDLLEATKPWVEKYRADLQEVRQDIRPDRRIDFNQREWWR